MQKGSATHSHCISSGHFRSTGGFFLQLCVWGEVEGGGGRGEERYMCLYVHGYGVCVCVCVCACVACVGGERCVHVCCV